MDDQNKTLKLEQSTYFISKLAVTYLQFLCIMCFFQTQFNPMLDGSMKN